MRRHSKSLGLEQTLTSLVFRLMSELLVSIIDYVLVFVRFQVKPVGRSARKHVAEEHRSRVQITRL